MHESGYGESFYAFPEIIDPGPGNNFLHFAEKFMSIIHPGDVFYPGYQVAGENRIEVDRTYEISFLDEQVKKKPQVKFGIKQEPFIKKAPDTVLLIRHDCQRYRAGQFPASEGYVVTCKGE